MKIKVIPFSQNDQKFYIGVIKVSELLDKSKTDMWDPKNLEGYQREVSKPRARQFGRYLAHGGVSPMCLLVNVRDLDITEQKDWIEIPNDVELWLVDGQHRVEGLREVVDEYPQIRNLELPIIISNFRNKYDEAKQFLIINKTQKGVRPDLAERILQKVVEKEGMEKIIQERGRGYLKAIFRDIEWRTKAIEVVDKLNSIKDSPFYKRVRYPNTPKITTVVREISLTDSLQPIFKDDLLGELPVDLLAKAPSSSTITTSGRLQPESGSKRFQPMLG